MNHSFDIAVVGAGAAGLMTAISSARASNNSLNIVLLDSREKIGAKILISGGTRCNVTNVRVTPQDYQGGPRHFVKHVLEAFTPDQTLDFFMEIGVELILEPTGKYFPTTHSGKTVLEALMKEADARGVKLWTGAKITAVQREKDRFTLRGEGIELHAKKVVLTTGGLSYPETGSDGTGYTIAKSLGHSVTPTFASLTPLESSDELWKSLSGIAVPATLSFFKSGKKEAEFTEALLFTHFGFSGPVALDISRFIAATIGTEPMRLEASFLVNEKEEAFKELMNKEKKSNAARQLKNFLSDRFLLPERLTAAILQKAGSEERVILKHVSFEAQKKLTHNLFHQDLNVTGVLGYKKAEVTAGGVPLSEIKGSTMQSRTTDGLYFAGEILDVDGRIGGFNFQWAWSSGYSAGTSAAKECLK